MKNIIIKFSIFLAVFFLMHCSSSSDDSSEVCVDADGLTIECGVNGDITCVDADGDGYTLVVTDGSGTSAFCSEIDDCDDTDPNSFPGGTEIADDGIDQDCDDSDLSSTSDSDLDLIADSVDNCPDDANYTQDDADGDLVGDVCDLFPSDPYEWSDIDSDGVGDNGDVCMYVSNADTQTDSDYDGYGDDCDAFSTDASEWSDSDSDGVGDNSDNCVTTSNADQYDTEGDGKGNECDTDDDDDGVLDTEDNCPLTANMSQEDDAPADGIGDACATDADGDGVSDIAVDNCVGTYNPGQGDSDSNGVGDACDPEVCTDGIDNDGDGGADCEDSDCTADSTCTGVVAEDCSDEIDNDGDGAVDCDDSDCGEGTSCTAEVCDDGIDNDGGGLADCEDPDCITSDTYCPNSDDDEDGLNNSIDPNNTTANDWYVINIDDTSSDYSYSDFADDDVSYAFVEGSKYTSFRMVYFGGVTDGISVGTGCSRTYGICVSGVSDWSNSHIIGSGAIVVDGSPDYGIEIKGTTRSIMTGGDILSGGGILSH